ncbi:hypothetical protein D4R42_01255 [bacterium]|nr:MAG: hypothetical protein D4R42_01255 [bacterium]
MFHEKYMQTTKQKKQLILIGVIVAITIGILLFNKKGSSKSSVATTSYSTPVISINKQFQGIEDLDLGILLEDSFVDLKKVEGYPIKVGDIGRDNPFVPYE